MPQPPKLSTSRANTERHRRERTKLEVSGQASDLAVCQTLAPPGAPELSSAPVSMENGWLGWPLLTELLPANFPGVTTSRDDFFVTLERADLQRRMVAYSNAGLPDEEIARRYPGAMESTTGFDAHAVRAELIKRGPGAGFIEPFCYGPFELRWIYWEPDTNLLDRGRPDYFAQVFPDNLWLEARQKPTDDDFDRGYVTNALAGTFGNGCSNFFPLLVRDANFPGGLLGEPRPNFSPAALAYLAGFGADVPPDSLFFHAVATLHAPAYRAENAGALRQDWPRIPLPADREVLLTSAALGRRVAALLDPETPVPGVTAGPLPPMLLRIGTLSHVDSFPNDPHPTPLDPATDLAVTAGWGHFGQCGAVMPGRGLLSEFNDLDAGGLEEVDGENLRTGPDYLRVYLNERALWDCVPPAVWNYTLGGYPVLKTWLSSREQSVLGRPLRPEEAREFTAIARRIAALLALGPDLDAAHHASATGAATL